MFSAWSVGLVRIFGENGVYLSHDPRLSRSVFVYSLLRV